MAVDRLGREHDVDARAWQPFVSEELLAWTSRRMLELEPANRDRAGEYLVGLVEQGRQDARRGHVGYFDRIWGPLAAPYFLLHPKWWSPPSSAPSEPLVGFRLYTESWNLDERRTRPSAVHRTLEYQYPPSMMRDVPRRISAIWERFWFAPTPALDLAAARVIFAAHAIWIVGSLDLPAISGVPAVFWARVPLVDRWRFLLFPGHALLEQSLQLVALAALVAAALGIWSRVACFCAGLLLYHLAPLETIFWTPNPFERGLTVDVLALLTLSFSRSGDALSLVPTRSAEASASGDYRWPIRLVQLFLCQIYFISGYAKLTRAGLAWVSAGNIRGWLLVFSQQDQIAVSGTLGKWLADQPLACLLIAVGAITVDLGIITIVIWPRLRAWFISAALIFHAGILLTMGILFLNVPQFLIFVDWEVLRRRWRDARVVRRPSPSRRVAFP